MSSFYCPQQLLAPFLKLAFPDVPENYLSVGNCCFTSSERTCCLRSLKLVLPSTFSVSSVIYFSSITGVPEQASGFPEFPLVQSLDFLISICSFAHLL